MLASETVDKKHIALRNVNDVKFFTEVLRNKGHSYIAGFLKRNAPRNLKNYPFSVNLVRHLNQLHMSLMETGDRVELNRIRKFNFENFKSADVDHPERWF